MSSSELIAKNRSRTQWIVLAAIAAGVPIFCLLNYRFGSSTKSVTLMSAFVTLGFLYTFMLTGFRKFYRVAGQELPKILFLGALALAVTSFASTWIGVSLMKHHNDYVDLALSDKPLQDIQPEQKRLVVELMRRRIANSKENDKDIADATQHPLNPQLYTPESFGNKDIMDRTISRLTVIVDRDLEYGATADSNMQDFRQKMAKVDPEYLKSWEASDGTQDAAQRAAHRAEEDWFTSTKQLYAFAMSHADKISASDGAIKIADSAISEEFKQKLATSEALHDKLNQLVQEQVKAQQKSKQAIVLP